ncbi:unnamed protein product [marine sediment metagenome]|uniref:Uncharacterized protein n=1 Tax=marine sediment metagenome TaxID=412755 RepID=X0UA34_9ZZZZ
MNDADVFFGTKEPVEMPTAQPTHFGRYPARIRAVCDAFMDEMGWSADPTTIRDVAAGAKRFVDVHGDNPGLVRKTIRYIRHREPHIYKKIGDPGSLYKIARRFTNKPEENRDRYLIGVEDE